MPAVTLTVSIKIASSPSALELLTLFDTGHICSTSSAAGFISAAASRASPRSIDPKVPADRHLRSICSARLCIASLLCADEALSAVVGILEGTSDVTNSNDPNLSRPDDRETDRDEASSDYTTMVAGALAALIVILGIIAMISRTDSTSTTANVRFPPVATTTTPAQATVPPATTGSAAR